MYSCLLFVVMCAFVMESTDGKLVRLGSHQARITRLHNYYRYLESASNMELLVWDWTLARKAAYWSEKCKWAHQKKGFGENLSYYWSTGTLKKSNVIKKSIESWYNEKYSWRWSRYCGNACHYTQMVWAKTTRIGCAYSICRSLRTTGRPIKNAHYLVCFYDPPGNYIGQYPYKYGQRCSKCKKGYVCKDKLCCRKSRSRLTKYMPFAYRSYDS